MTTREKQNRKRIRRAMVTLADSKSESSFLQVAFHAYKSRLIWKA